MKIRPRPKYHGWYAFVAAYAFIVVCLPLLKGAISVVSKVQSSQGEQIAAWSFVILLSSATAYLVREFLMQLWHCFRQRSEPRYPKSKRLR